MTKINKIGLDPELDPNMNVLGRKLNEVIDILNEKVIDKPETFFDMDEKMKEKILFQAAQMANDMQAETLAKAKLKEEFEKNFGTGVNMNGDIIGGDNDGAPLDYNKIWRFIDRALATREQEVLEEVRKKVNQNIKGDEDRIMVLVKIFRVLDQLKKK